MKVTMRPSGNGYECIVERTDKQEKFKKSGFSGAAVSSAFLHAVMIVLTARGYDLIKTSPDREYKLKRACHLTSLPYFLQAREGTRAPHVMIHNQGNYMLWDEGEKFNTDGIVTLEVSLDIFGKQPDCGKLIDALESGEPDPFCPIGFQKWQITGTQAVHLNVGLGKLYIG